MPLWAESRIHGDVYVRFGGRLSETYHRKVAWRRQPSLRITDQKINVDMESLAAKLNGIFTAPLTPSKESVRREQHQREVQKFAVAAGLA